MFLITSQLVITEFNMAGLRGLLDSAQYASARAGSGMSKLEQIDAIIADQNKPKEGLARLVDSAGQVSRRDNVNNYLLKQFGSPAIAAGIAGNIDVETGGTFDFMQKQVGGGPGRGLIQMGVGGMNDDYENFINKTGRQNSAESQIDFMQNILQSGEFHDIGHGNRIKMRTAFETGNPQIISEAFMKWVERPKEGSEHSERRFKSSQEHFNRFSQR